MKLLVELMDRRDSLLNILAPHAFHPERLVYLYDPDTDTEMWNSLHSALARKYPAMQLEARAVDAMDADSIEAVCRSVADEPGAVFDLTGGNDLVAAVAAKFCAEHAIPRFLLAGDPPVFTDLGGAAAYADQYRPPLLTLEDLTEPIGACVSGNMHRPPRPEQYEDILSFFRRTQDNPKAWRQYCNYLQEVTDMEKKDSRGHIRVDAPATVNSSRHHSLHNDPSFAVPAAEAGFLERYRAERGRVHFYYPDKTTCYYMITQGVWLEMFCYINASRLGWFHDIRMSALFDWNANPNEPGNVINEIDLVLIYQFTPLFLSCKTSVPTTDDLNEIFLYAKKFGGAHAHAAIATTVAIRQIPLSVRNRASEMSVGVLAKEMLTPRRFGDYLRRLFRIPSDPSSQG